MHTAFLNAKPVTYLLHFYGRFPVEPGLTSYPLVLFLLLLSKRTFEDKWHRFSWARCPSCHTINLSQSTEGFSEHRPKPGLSVIHHQTVIHCSLYASSTLPVSGNVE